MSDYRTRTSCYGQGVIICRCGGDVCACGANEFDCPGCNECEVDEWDDAESGEFEEELVRRLKAWDYETWFRERLGD